ncbi:MAG: bifunctional 4-hydroxy-2-oxoglutarate aldolase/2-dehydro-3-deoxy-phosphogluconate aldolase [Crocinitomicaceae bacterium]|nr:bifunctional 4-hydroxy-2-oxoglutarate aldolase/2-dehydro-3-deoxy-phosphogluconate aldolase [Crocinitomicaceae bacterium]
MKQNNIREVLSHHPIIPVINFNDIDEVIPMIEKLKAKNIFCIEITLRTPIAFDAIRLAKEKFGDEITIGMGTIVSKDQIAKAIELKVDFLVSPGLSSDLASHFEDSGISFILGVATPSDIINGLQFGWDTFKFFPAHLFGGLNALKTYGQVFPQVKFCATGGITEETYQSYLELGNVISIGGSWLN